MIGANRKLTYKIAIILLTILVFIGFHKLYESLMCTTLINWFANYFDNTDIISVVFLIAIIFVVIFALIRIFKLGSSYFSFIEYLVSGVICYLWVYYRFFNKVWSFYPIFPTCNESIAYIDIIIASIVIISIGVGIKILIEYQSCRKNKKNLEEQKKNGLFSTLNIDNPIDSELDDLLNRKPFAENLVKELKKLNTSNSGCSVAVIAPWGAGKTSFINLVVEQVEKDATFNIMHFSPWHHDPDISITKQFFNQVIAEIGSFNAKLSRFIGLYSDLLTGSAYGKLLNLTYKSNLVLVR